MLRRHSPAALIVVTGLSLSVVGFAVIREREQERLREYFDRESEEAASTVEAGVARHLDVLDFVREFYAGSRSVEREEFDAFVDDALGRLDGLRTLMWVPRVPASQRTAFEEVRRAEGFGEFRIHPLTDRAEHFLVDYIFPYQGHAAAHGYDLASDPDGLAGIDRARDSGMITASRPRPSTDEVAGQASLLVCVPIYANGQPQATVEQRREHLLGVVVAELWLNGLFEVALAGQDITGLLLRCWDVTEPESPVLLASMGDTASAVVAGRGDPDRPQAAAGESVSATDQRFYETLDIAGRRWLLECQVSPGFGAHATTWLPVGVLVGGIGLALLSGACISSVVGRSARVDRLVRQRTAELKQARDDLEARVQRRTAELGTILDATPVATVVVDAATRQIVRVNPAALALTGQAADELIGHSCKEYWCLRHENRCPVIDGGRPTRCEGTLAARDGTEVHFLKQAVPVAIQGRSCVLETFTNVTELKRVEQRLGRSEVEYRTITACAQDAIITADATGTIRFWNGAAERVFGFTAEEVCGRNMMETIVPPQYHEAKRRGLAEFAQTGQGAAVGQTLELTGLRKDGREFPIEVSVSAYPTSEGPVAMAMIRDISDRKASEEQSQLFSRQQAALNALFEIGLEDVDLREMLERCLDEVLFNTWLVLAPRGAIFLVEDEPGVLVLAAQRNLATPLHAACARVPFGHCLCGRAAVEGRVVFADHVDERHEVRYEGMAPHGHYCVPIRVGERVLGVLVVYVNEGHVYSDLEEDFLQAVGNAIAGLVERKWMARARNRVIEQQGRLNRLQQNLLGPGELAQKLQMITDGAVDILGADFCRIWITRPGDRCGSGCMHAGVTEGPHVCRHRDRCLWLMASSGRYTHIDGEVHRRVPFGCYKIGRVAAGEEPKFLTNDVTTDPRVHNHAWAKELGLVSFAGYQLRPPDGETIGVLALFVKHAISPDEDALLEGLGNTVAQVVQKARADEELGAAHWRLLEASRQAGMADVATGVLHNVGNVLNSINVSASLAAGKMRQSRVTQLAKAADLLAQHRDDLGTFVTQDAKGKLLPGYLAQLAEHLAAEQTAVVTELDALTANVEHVKKIVSTQQSYAGVSGVQETVQLEDVLEDALKINASAPDRHGVDVHREYAAVPEVTLDKHKLMQILVNLLRNAKYAMSESGQAVRHLTLRLGPAAEGRIRIDVCDNGVGIPAENLTRIFAHGFTTRKDGHGFGLHSSALAARELGGRLSGHSAGPGRGATFTLELPGPSTET